MALIWLSSIPCLESVDAVGFNHNLSKRPVCFTPVRKYGIAARKRSSNFRCSLSEEMLIPLDFEEDDNLIASVSVEEEELDHVIKFNISDFQISDRVSIGLGGRGDEEVFEAVVKNDISPFYNTKLVLRRLNSVQAQRRGKRAIQVLKKLARRKLLYHSYSMQVHGYAYSSETDDDGSFTLVHGYHGSFSLKHWLQQADWLPTLEATLALDEDSAKRVGDDTVGGPAVSRQLRIIRILMRDLLIGVNYLHSHGLAHTELRLENIHISPLDRHIKVGILGNAADFSENSPNDHAVDDDNLRRQMMIAFDMRCVGFIMAKMVVRELMDPVVFSKFKAFLTQGNEPSCLREFLLQTLNKTSTSGNAGLQILDRNWGAGWNLLSLLLASRPSDRIRCLEALRHPFLCGPRWRVDPSMDFIRWSLGSTAVRIIEEYIYGQQQRTRVALFIELMEMLNCHSKPKNWLDLLPGKWRLLYCTGRHIGLTFRQPPARVLIGNVHLTVNRTSKLNTSLSFKSDMGFRVLVGKEWPHDKAGINGELHVNSLFRLMAGRRLYLKQEKDATKLPPGGTANAQDSVMEKVSGKKWGKALPFEEFPSSLRVAKLVSGDVEVSISLDKPLRNDVKIAQDVVQEVRTQVPPEMFDLSKIVCGTYVDERLLVLRGVNGSALFFTRSCTGENYT